MVLFTAAVLLGSQTDGRRRAWTTRDSHESRDVAGLVGVAGCAPAPPEVGVAGFEPTAPRSQSGCATKLRHTPWRPESRRTTAPRSGDLRARRTFGRPLWPDGAGSVLAEASDERALSEARDPFDAAGGGGAPSGGGRGPAPPRGGPRAAGGGPQTLDGEGLGLLGEAAFLVGAEEESVAAFRSGVSALPRVL